MLEKKVCLNCKKILSNPRATYCKSHRIFTIEHRNKMSKSAKGFSLLARINQKIGVEKRIGELHPNYKKDRSSLKKHDRRNDPAYKGWRIDVYRRDGYKCRIENKDCCGKIEAHHILSWKHYPELRYIINNGITLCYFHHPRKRQDEINLSPYFTEMVTNIK